MTKLSKTAKFYRSNTASRNKKKKYDAKLNAKESQTKKRVEANRARRKAKAAGKDVSGKDYDHATKRFVKSSTNRGRKGEGGRKKKRGC